MSSSGKKLEPNVFDVWTFRRTRGRVEYLLLHTSQYKAGRHSNGGRFWQIPSGFIQDAERVPAIVTYRGLKEGLRSTREYVTGIAEPSAELRMLWS